MHFFSKYIKGVFGFIVLIFLLFVFPINSIYAADLKFYNYNTNSYENYSGKQVIYTYNNREVPLEYPGIIINGTALADYNDLFVVELGLKAERYGDIITLSNGSTELTLTIGSTKVQINGSTDTMSVAPVKLNFDDTIKYYVPTRYVAETFGYDYVWEKDISTARITKTLQLACEDKNLSYNGTLYSINYDMNRIISDMPAIYYAGNVMVPAKQVFEAAGCIYSEAGKVISVIKGELTLSVQIGSKIAYINQKKIIGNSTPVYITDLASGKTEAYIALEFASDMLGFTLSYSDAKKCYTLKENEFTGKNTLYPEFAYPVDDQPIQTFFEWTAEGNTASDINNLSKVKAYAIKNAAVVELYGISKDNIVDFFDNGVVVFELKNVHTDIDTQLFYDYEGAHISYALLTKVNSNSKLFLQVPPEYKWTIIETEDCVRVYFSSNDLSINDLTISSVGESTVTGKAEILFPDDRVIIPLPDSVDITHISDEDKYWENKFFIKIAGNYKEFYHNNLICNPYYGVNISEAYYDFVNNLTILEFHTKDICGYNYCYENGYLSVSIGKPGEIYSKIVVFDAGHGGIDPGAAKKGFKEKDINFKILNTYVKEYFKKSDIKVYFTRETDIKVDLYERAAFASQIGADMFISLHLNSNNSVSVNGTEVYYSKENNSSTTSGFNSYQLAENLLDELCVALNSKKRGVINSDFIVTKYNTVPAVLIELGYMTNDTELSKLTNEAYQKKVAQAIYQTVTRLFETYY